MSRRRWKDGVDKDDDDDEEEKNEPSAVDAAKQAGDLAVMPM